MSQQDLLEISFKNRDISTLRKLKSNTDLDFSFNNNEMINTIINDSLHVNFLNLLKNKNNCFKNINTKSLLITALKNNNTDAFDFLFLRCDINSLLNTIDFNFFLEVTKINNIKYNKKLLNFFLSIINKDFTRKNEILKYLKSGITLIIENYTSEHFMELHFQYCADFFDNYYFIRTILSLPSNNKNKDLFLKYLSKKVTFSNNINYEYPPIDIKFLNCYNLSDSQKDCMEGYIFRYALHYTTVVLNSTDYDIKKTHYDDYTKLVFNSLENSMLSNKNGRFNRIINLISSIINNNKSFIKNDLIIYLINKYSLFNVNLIRCTISNLNLEVFDFIYELLNLSTHYYEDFSYLILPPDGISLKEREYFNDKIINTASMQKLIKDPNLICLIADYDHKIFNYLLCKIPDLLNCIKEYEQIEEIYITVLDYNNQKTLNALLSINFGFNYLNPELFTKKINNTKKEELELFTRAYKLYHF